MGELRSERWVDLCQGERSVWGINREEDGRLEGWIGTRSGNVWNAMLKSLCSVQLLSENLGEGRIN